MAVGYTTSATGSVSVPGISHGIPGSATLTLTLGSTPTSGWLLIAAISNNPTSCATSSATWGSITIPAPLDYGTGITSGGGNSFPVPTLFAMPYQSGMTSANTVTLFFGNSGAVATGYACAIVITGAAAYDSTWLNYRTTTGGLIDGASANNALDSLTTSNGSTSISSGVLTFTNSAGIATSYDAQDQPFVMATWQSGSIGSLTGLYLTAATTISAGVITTSGQSSGTITMSSNTGFTSTGGSGFINSANGVIYFTYTGTSGTTQLTGCTVSSSSGFYNYSTSLLNNRVVPNSSSIGYAVPLQTSTVGAQPINGFSLGVSSNNSQQFSMAQISTASFSGGLASGYLTMTFGQATGMTKTPAYIYFPSNPATAGATFYTLVPATRTMSRTSTATKVLTAKASKVIGHARTSLATAISSALASKTLTKARTVIATHVRVASASKTAQRVKTATATMVRSPFASKIAVYLRTSQATHVRTAIVTSLKSKIRTAIATMTRSASASKSVNHARSASASQVRATFANKIVHVLRRATATLTLPARALKAATYNRTAKATAVNSVTVTKRLTRNKQVYAVAVYSTSTSKTRTYARRAIATAIAVAKASPIVRRFVTHPGTVSADIVVPTVRGSIETASVTASTETATVRASIEI